MIPVRSRHTRWAIVVYGLAVFLWSGPESTQVWPVVLLGMCGAGLSAYVWITPRLGGRRLQPPTLLALFGALGIAVGLGTAVLTVALMLFKDIRHAHLFPDYPPLLLGAVLARAPVWMIAGGLIGLGLGMLLALQREE